MPRLNLRPEALARLAPVATVALVVLLAQGAADLTWRLVPLPTAPVPSADPERPAASATTAEPAVTDYDAIAGWHLFGEVGTAPPPPPVPVAAPETRLNLRLVGLFYAESGASALALIAEGNGEELPYRVGADLPGGATLEQIRADHVVLSRNGRMETLSLPRDEVELEVAVDSPDSVDLAAPDSDSSAMDPTGGIVVDASAIAGQLREAAAVDPRSLQDLAFVDPYIQDGQFVGFRLRPGRDRRLLRRLGLRSGDVLTAVNGVRLDDPARGLTLLESLYSADEVSILVLRNGSEIAYTFRLSEG